MLILTEARLLIIKKCISDSALEIIHISTREFSNKKKLYYVKR